MIIFAWKVNNPLSFLISRPASESFKSLFPAPFQFVLEFSKTYTDFMLFSYSLNSNHDVSLLGALLLYAAAPPPTVVDPATAPRSPSARVYETSATSPIPSEPK